MSNSETVENIFTRLSELETTRTPYEAVWDEITEYVMPSRGSYSFKDTKSDPERKSRRRFESTAINAARGLTAKIIAEMTSGSTRWFEYRDPDPNIDKLEPVRRALQALSDKAYVMLNSGSFKLAHAEATADWVAYGTACMLTDFESDGEPIFQSIPIRELYIAENRAGEIDLVIRKFKLTLRQIIQIFGEQDLPAKILQNKERDFDKLHDVIHAVIPNDEYVEGKKNSRYFRFKSCYALCSGKVLLREGGYKRMPYKVFRFWKRSGEVYGGSPAVDALADIRVLNMLEEASLRGIQLDNWPPFLAAHDSVIMPLKVVPNGINYGGIGPDGRRLIDRLLPPNPGGRQGLETMLEQKRMAIRSCFFIDPLINKQNSIRTAAEVMKRSNEEMMGLSPFLARYEVEYLSPIIDHMLEYLLTKKEVEIPQELNGRTSLVEYTGPLAKTQRASELNNTMQFLQLVQGVAQVDPSMLQHLDFNAAFMMFADLLGVPLSIITPAQQIAAKQQMMQQQQQASALGQGLGDVSKNLALLAKSGLLQRQDLGLPPGVEG